MASDQWLPIGSDVPAAGEAPDRAAEPPEPDAPSLAALIRAGDPDALLGFRDAHEPAVRAYMEETVCGEDRVEEAVDSSFTDLFGRLTADDDESTDLEALLLVSARSAAAGRFEVSSEPARRARSDLPQCPGAARRQGQRRAREGRAARAPHRALPDVPEQRGADAGGRAAVRCRDAGRPARSRTRPRNRRRPRNPRRPRPRNRPRPAGGATEPQPEPTTAPPPQTIVRRSGGLVGGLRKTFDGHLAPARYVVAGTGERGSASRYDRRR